ncbi:glycosyltransferase [Rhodococcus fascians]|uniref:glycosyltransferase n=1 Tax=Rhodococcoides fascians TaxID=1828 RepID=UPI0024BBBB9F|nr:glycosyltransferase [Rhodococcus fascians]MDJ0428022.1 glycosyltransferase [Rhodococcus fascians]
MSRILDLRAEAQYPPLAYFSVSDFVARRISADTLPEVPTITVYNAIERPLDVQILPPIERDFDICFVGRLEDEKGLARAVELARTDRYRWAFVGGGSLRPVVEELAEGSVGRVNYLGPLTYDRTMSVMSRSKVAVVPSIWDEPFGRVAVEAMAVGAVPLVANRGGLPEAVRGLPIDAVVQAPNDDAWRKKCREVLDLDSVALSALSNAAIEVWKTNFAEQTLGSTLKRHYETLLSQRAAVLRNG